MKLLVLTPEPVDASMLRSVLGEEIEGAEVLVISPATTTNPVVISVSHATRLSGSSASAASSTESEIWSAILSG